MQKHFRISEKCKELVKEKEGEREREICKAKIAKKENSIYDQRNDAYQGENRERDKQRKSFSKIVDG